MLPVSDIFSLSDSQLDFSQESSFSICYEACLKGDLKQVKLLINEDTALLSQCDEEGQTLLYACATSNELEILEWLIEKSPLVLKQVRNDGKTLMHIAAIKGHFELVKWLNDKDSSFIDQFDKNHFTPLHEAAFHEQIPICKLFVEKLKNNESLIIQIVQRKCPKTLAFLLESGVEPDVLKSLSHLTIEEQKQEVANNNSSHVDEKGLLNEKNMIETNSSVMELVKNWCLTSPQPTILVAKKELKKSIFAAFETLSIPDRWSLILKIDRQLSHKDCDPEKVQLFKKVLEKTHGGSWKNNLLSSDYGTLIDCFYPFLKYSNEAHLPLTLKERCLLFLKQNVCAYIGSTFSTNNPLMINQKGHCVLDSTFACVSEGGFTLALGDGAGGHLGDFHQDASISKASHSGCKTAARLFSAYKNGDELYEALQDIVSEIGKKIKQEGKGEGTTLLACRAFRVKNGYRIVGFNIGDGMLVGWDPATKQSYQLCTSHVTNAGPSFLPNACHSFEIQKIDSILPEGSLLFLMSDGVHDNLPYNEEKGEYSNFLKYTMRSLSSLEPIFGNIPTKSPVKTYLKTLMQTCINNAEEHRASQTALPNIKMGDDVSILQCYLSPSF